MSDKFDKKLRKEFEKNMAVSHPNINISNLSKVDESDLHNYYFNASYEAEELLLKFIQSNDKIDINNFYCKEDNCQYFLESKGGLSDCIIQNSRLYKNNKLISDENAKIKIKKILSKYFSSSLKNI